ncbi:hypothetical protein V6Z12_D07G108000 [Gossypium hirsutum]
MRSSLLSIRVIFSQLFLSFLSIVTHLISSSFQHKSVIESLYCQFNAAIFFRKISPGRLKTSKINNNHK